MAEVNPEDLSKVVLGLDTAGNGHAT